MPLSLINLRSFILVVHAIFCAIALCIMIDSIFYEQKMNSFVIIEKLFVSITLIFISFFSLKSLYNKTSKFVLIGNILIVLLVFLHIFIDVLRVGIERYFAILADMLRLGYFYPHASIAFGAWNLCVFFVVRSKNAACVVDVNS